METNRLTWDDAKEAASLLKNGKIIAFPTETVYGLGAIYNKKSAYDELVKVKNRPESKPFTLMCYSAGQASKYCYVDVGTIALFNEFMPGEITLLLKPRENLPSWVTLGSQFVGVRVPAEPKLCDLIEMVGEPLLVPSANKSGEKPALSYKEASQAFDGEIPAIIDGSTKSNLPSTIVKIDDHAISLVREGPVPFEKLKECYENAFLTVAIASDHGAYDLKDKVADHLLEIGVSVIDYGTESRKSCDYPHFAEIVANDVAKGKEPFGIVLCTSGEGISIAANKVNGVRCGIGYDDEVTEKMREHNNANVIAFGAKYMNEDDVIRRVDIFLSTAFSPLEKHHRRVKQIEEIEKRN